jgi:hypothetical protein
LFVIYPPRESNHEALAALPRTDSRSPETRKSPASDFLRPGRNQLEETNAGLVSLTMACLSYLVFLVVSRKYFLRNHRIAVYRINFVTLL